MKRYEITFKYADSASHWKWRIQSCSLYADNPSEAEEKCIALYGLDDDCEYEIVEVKSEDEKGEQK